MYILQTTAIMYQFLQSERAVYTLHNGLNNEICLAWLIKIHIWCLLVKYNYVIGLNYSSLIAYMTSTCIIFTHFKEYIPPVPQVDFLKLIMDYVIEVQL